MTPVATIASRAIAQTLQATSITAQSRANSPFGRRTDETSG